MRSGPVIPTLGSTSTFAAAKELSMATYDVADRSAIVTGAGSGIGRAIATLLAANGAAVLVTDLREEAVNEVVGELTAAGGTAAGLAGDVSDPEWHTRAVAA